MLYTQVYTSNNPRPVYTIGLKPRIISNNYKRDFLKPHEVKFFTSREGNEIIVSKAFVVCPSQH